MIKFNQIEISYDIFSCILHFIDQKDLGKIALISKGCFQATFLFREAQLKLPLKNIQNFNQDDLKGLKVLEQWQQIFDSKKQKEYEGACKQDPELQKQVEERATDVVTACLPMVAEMAEKFEKTKEAPLEQAMGNFFDGILGSIFSNWSELNKAIDPNAPPTDEKVLNVTRNIMTDFMQAFAKPQNFNNWMASMSSGLQQIDENTPLGNIADMNRPLFEIMHPILAKHFEAVGCPLSEKELQASYEELKNTLNAEYGSLNDYLNRAKALQKQPPDEILEEVLQEMTGSSSLVSANLNHSALSDYRMDFSHPKNDYEKGMVAVGSMMPSELRREIEPLLSKVCSHLYAAAGCQTPEEFQERSDKLNELKSKASEQMGRHEALKQHREQIVAMITAQENFDPQNLAKVNRLFDLMEQKPEIEKSFDAIYQKAFQYQLKSMPSMVKLENIEEAASEVNADILDPLSSIKLSEHLIQKMLTQMAIYWKEETQNLSDPNLILQYEVAGLELQATIPSAMRCQLHKQYARSLSTMASTNLLESGNHAGKSAYNPIKLTEFDHAIGTLMSNHDLHEQLDLLRSIPLTDEQSMVNRILQKTRNDHQALLNAFNNQDVIIEEVNE